MSKKSSSWSDNYDPRTGSFANKPKKKSNVKTIHLFGVEYQQEGYIKDFLELYKQQADSFYELSLHILVRLVDRYINLFLSASMV